MKTLERMSGMNAISTVVEFPMSVLPGKLKRQPCGEMHLHKF